MKILVRIILTVAALIIAVALLFGGIFLGTGSLDFLQNAGFLPNFGSPESVPDNNSSQQEIPSETEGAITIRFIWRGDEIIYDENVISESEFEGILAEAKLNDAKVEIIKTSDVEVETADRRRQLLDEAGVRYEIISQE
jgi:hypothetical protein